MNKFSKVLAATAVSTALVFSSVSAPQAQAQGWGATHQGFILDQRVIQPLINIAIGVSILGILLAALNSGSTMTEGSTDLGHSDENHNGSSTVGIGSHEAENKVYNQEELLQAAQHSFRLINNERSSQGLRVLTWSDRLYSDAKSVSENSARNGQLIHQFPDEALYFTPGQDLYVAVANAVSAWRGSASHNAIVMDRTHKIGAVAVVQGKDHNGNEGFFFTFHAFI